MKQSNRFVIIVLALLLLPLLLCAQKNPMKGKMYWGPDNSYVQMYNPDKVETISVEVMKVNNFIPRSGMSMGIHLLTKMGDNELTIHLGPAWYINNQEISISPGDLLEVRGSRVLFNDREVIIASEVVKGDFTLMLRDKNGMPRWAGWRKRMMPN